VERKLQSLRDEALRTFSMAMRNQVMKKILSCTLVTGATIDVGASVIRAEKVRAGGQFSAGPESGRQTWPEDEACEWIGQNMESKSCIRTNLI
jgi:hypothetical protein